MNHLKLFIKSIVFIELFFSSLVHASSYDDFFRAVTFDDVHTVQTLLLRGFDPNSVDPKGRPALMLAIQEPSPKVAELLIRWPNTRVDIRNPADESPLMMAALRGHVQMAELLITRKAAINKTGWTPLHYAAAGPSPAIVDLLIQRGANVNADSPNGTTPLMMAAQYGSPYSVKSLIQADADLLKQNQQGLTAFDFSVLGARPDAESLMREGLARLKIYPPATVR